MSKIHLLAAGVMSAALALVAPVAAQAAPSAQATAAPANTASVNAPAADGLLHVYYGLNYSNQCAAWSGNVANWGACRNQVESLWNTGYTDDVYVYYSPDYANARRGICLGVGLSDLRPWPFEQNEGAGSGQSLWKNIASSHWQIIAGCR